MFFFFVNRCRKKGNFNVHHETKQWKRFVQLSLVTRFISESFHIPVHWMMGWKYDSKRIGQRGFTVLSSATQAWRSTSWEEDGEGTKREGESERDGRKEKERGRDERREREMEKEMYESREGNRETMLLLKKRGWGWEKRYRPPSEARSIPTVTWVTYEINISNSKQWYNMAKSKDPGTVSRFFRNDYFLRADSEITFKKMNCHFISRSMKKSWLCSFNYQHHDLLN